MNIYFSLLKHLYELQRFSSFSPDKLRQKQLERFRHIFEHAREHSPFYRQLYRDAGVDRLVILNWSDIDRIPIVDKAMLRSVPAQDLMTRPITSDLVRTTTSGSTAEPFVIYQTRNEQYTAHVRMFAMLMRMCWRPWLPIVLLWRHEPDAILPVEKSVSLIAKLRRRFGLFQRIIISIYTPMSEILSLLDTNANAAVFWSTPGMAAVLCDHLEQHDRRFTFPLVVLTSETLSPSLLVRCQRFLGDKVISGYGSMEAPIFAFDSNDGNHFRVDSNFSLVELVNRRVDFGREVGDVVLTNLVNHTMPFIRFRIGDVSEVLAREECPAQVLGPILGRIDDVLTLSDGRRFAYHHGYALFMDFSHCTQYKFVQYPDGQLALRLRLRDGECMETVRDAALTRWRTRFAEVPLAVEFVETMPVDARTGKFKSIERMDVEARKCT